MARRDEGTGADGGDTQRGDCIRDLCLRYRHTFISGDGVIATHGTEGVARNRTHVMVKSAERRGVKILAVFLPRNAVQLRSVWQR